MDAILTRLEQLLDLMAQPDGIEDDRLAALPGEWEEVVRQLLHETQIGGHDPADKRRWAERLEKQIRRLPDVQTGLLGYQSEIAVQLYAGGRRLDSLRQVQDGMAVCRRPLVCRQA
ncbi:MAG: hypothetical protein HQL66_01790 [Magnetococcales bacterium]|nr:hypothetical protein [Magnetococcales bacterium]